MQVADEQSYEEVIHSLQSYIGEVARSAGDMRSAGTDCVDNTLNDPAAVKSNERLQSAISKIESAVADIRGVIKDLQDELEEIREAAEAANSAD
ncbi:hypothetical protein [Butyrivibrio sp. FCS014]|uniref:hypothetical protein n=1 Tax=Butyrivibrio sp. FCS014 TaxID=1408304 RepID=UPI00046653E7|nr:hypothetical protein [Butyrivibrio sp. FCS014]